MKNFKCDMCDKDVAEYKLTTLHKTYRSSGIEDLCTTCNEAADNFLWWMKDQYAKFQSEMMQNFIKEKKKWWSLQGFRK